MNRSRPALLIVIVVAPIFVNVACVSLLAALPTPDQPDVPPAVTARRAADAVLNETVPVPPVMVVTLSDPEAAVLLVRPADRVAVRTEG